jgi:D-alanine--poly(phosphoribitol) ligase subunit 1
VNYNLAGSFFEHAAAAPSRAALWVDGSEYTFAELASLSMRTADWLGPVPRVGILGSRSLAAYAGILGSAWSGAAYVPMNPKAPEDRLVRMFESVGFDAIVADEAGLAALTARLLNLCGGRVIAPCSSSTPAWAAGARDLPPARPLTEPLARDASALAYVIFTSGSTGIPKGVMISAGSVRFFVDAIQERFSFGPQDRFSQASELTFDVSVFELFAAWNVGASVHVVPGSELMAPSRFIRTQAVTVWSSVPSIPAIMRRLRMLRAGAFPELRYSLFAGEPLPLDLAHAWQAAAPASVIENLYGPTEATIVCIGSRVTPDTVPTPGRGTVPTGMAFPGTRAAILDSHLDPLLPGSEGQLALAGPNLALGYLNDPALTAARFPRIRGRKWYLTGDLARQDAAGVFHHLGRIDHQVKILGNRVELEEIEAHLRDITQSSEVAAVAWPVSEGCAQGIVAFLTSSELAPEAIRTGMQARVPAYMIPRLTIHLDSLPLNPNGKVDRAALIRHLENQTSQGEPDTIPASISIPT